MSRTQTSALMLSSLLAWGCGGARGVRIEIDTTDRFNTPQNPITWVSVAVEGTSSRLEGCLFPKVGSPIALEATQSCAELANVPIDDALVAEETTAWRIAEGRSINFTIDEDVVDVTVRAGVGSLEMFRMEGIQATPDGDYVTTLVVLDRDPAGNGLLAEYGMCFDLSIGSIGPGDQTTVRCARMDECVPLAVSVFDGRPWQRSAATCHESFARVLNMDPACDENSELIWRTYSPHLSSAQDVRLTLRLQYAACASGDASDSECELTTACQPPAARIRLVEAPPGTGQSVASLGCLPPTVGAFTVTTTLPASSRNNPTNLHDVYAELLQPQVTESDPCFLQISDVQWAID